MPSFSTQPTRPLLPRLQSGDSILRIQDSGNVDVDSLEKFTEVLAHHSAEKVTSPNAPPQQNDDDDSFEKQSQTTAQDAEAPDDIHLHPLFNEDVFADAKPTKQDKLEEKRDAQTDTKKIIKGSDNVEFHKELEEANPLTAILALRLIGYANETFESLIGPVAAATSVLGAGKILSKDAAFASNTAKAASVVHDGTAFSPYVKGGLVGTRGLAAFEKLEGLSYGLVKAYCGIDALYHGYRGFKTTKEDTDDNKFAAARASQLVVGQGAFQFMASFAVPAMFIKEFIFKGVKSVLSAPANIAYGALNLEKVPAPKDARHGVELLDKSKFPDMALLKIDNLTKRVGESSNPFFSRIGRTLDANFIAENAAKHIPNKRMALGFDVAASIGAGIISLMAMPTVASYLDPMFEKATHDLWYKPTNKLLAKYFPNAYNQQLVQFEADKDPENRSLSDDEIKARLVKQDEIKQRVAQRKAEKLAKKHKV